MIQLALGFPGERFIYLPLSLIDVMIDSPLTGDLILYSLGHFSHARYHYINRINGCKQYIFIYCKEGKGWIEVNKQKYTLTANDFIVLPPDIPHSYGASQESPWSIYWMHFIGTKAELFAKKFYVPTKVNYTESSEEERFKLFEEMYSTLRNGFTIDNLNYTNICLKHFLATFRFQNSHKSPKVVSEYSESIINRVIAYMNNHINQKVTIGEMAAFLGYSVSYFHRKFYKATGQSPINYFIQMKVNKACIELIKTDLKITQIASKLGFKDSYYFSRIFTQTMGISPKKFREQGFKLDT